MKSSAKTNPIDTLRMLPENKKCFDCHEKGTMYVVLNFGVFVCSTCAGIHREMNHKVKGISLCTFSDAEIKDITKNGNENQQKQLMATWSSKKYPEPPKSETYKVKEFLKAKYVEKRFCKSNKVSDSESESDDEEYRKKKKELRKKKRERRRKAAKEESSSDEEAKVEEP